MARAHCVAAGLVAALAPSSSGAAPVPAALPIDVDGAPVRIVLKPEGPPAQLAFRARAGQRLGLGISAVKFTPKSAAALVVTVRGPDGAPLRGFRTVHCRSASAENPDAACDGELALDGAGRYVIEVDAPFSAETELGAFLSSPAVANLHVGASHTVSLSRPGQDAWLHLPLASGTDVTVAARGRAVDATRSGAFAMRLHRPDGTLMAERAGDAMHAPSVRVTGSPGVYAIEIDPANGGTGSFVVTARQADGADAAAAGSASAAPPATAAVRRSVQERDAFSAVSAALNEADFGKLERLHDEFLALHLAGGAGGGMLAVFPQALSGGLRGDPSRLEKLFADWREAVPGSRLRASAEAATWAALAWRARGAGEDSAVPAGARELFRAHLARAAKALEDDAERAKESPVWYWAALSVGGSLGLPAASLDAMFDEGSAKFPAFTPLAHARLNFLLPRRGGDYDVVDAFIRHAVMHTQASEGTAPYAALYVQVMRAFRGDDFFRETRASWRLMQHAFEEQVARGTVDLRSYAAAACIAADRETAARLIEMLREESPAGDSGDASSTGCPAGNRISVAPVNPR